MNHIANSTPNSGNVYADLGFDDPDEEMVKAELALVNSRYIGQQQWTDDQAARTLGIKAERLAAVREGRLGRVSITNLIQLLRRMNFDVEISVAPNPSAARSARYGVVSGGRTDLPDDGPRRSPERIGEEQDAVLQAQEVNGRDTWQRPAPLRQSSR